MPEQKSSKKEQPPKETEPKEEVASTQAEQEPEQKDEPKEHEEQSTKPAEEKKPEETKTKHKHFARLRHFAGTTKGKVTFGVLAVLLIIGVLLGIPTTRYAILGTVIKKDVSVTFIDAATKKPVTEANATIDGQQITSGNDGKATFKNVSVGPHKITVQKKYYTDQTATIDVWILSAAQPSQIQLTATGRQVPLKIINKLNKQPVENALITASESNATTNANGEAVIVLPADQTEVGGNVSHDGYNNAPVTITVTEQQADANTFSITPSGKVYFLSKRTGVINVMKSNLDGTQQAVVLEGTGTEEEGQTQLVATRDWHYMALKARRDGAKQAKLYLLNSQNDTLSTIETQDADYNVIGWYNEYFIYTVNGKRLKSYNANTGTIAVLDETQKLGDNSDYANEYFDSIHILENDVVYAKNWQYSCKIWNSNGYCQQYTDYINGKNNVVMSVAPNNTNKRVVHTSGIIPGQNSSFMSKVNKTKEIWYSQYNTGANKRDYFIYTNGTFTATTSVNDSLFYQPNTTYYSSPSGNYSFWYEPRDGKNTLLVGDSAGNSSQAVASGTDYKSIGWYTDDYMLAAKNGSELFIMPRQNVEGNISKVTDFHKPQYDWSGQGYSYGWFY